MKERCRGVILSLELQKNHPSLRKMGLEENKISENEIINLFSIYYIYKLIN